MRLLIYLHVARPSAVPLPSHDDQYLKPLRPRGFIGRAVAVDHKHTVSYWISAAEQILRELGGASETLSGLSFLAAALAHGDVFYNDVRDFPYVREFGLREYGGRPATDAWRKVLATGKIPEPGRAREVV